MACASGNANCDSCCNYYLKSKKNRGEKKALGFPLTHSYNCFAFSSLLMHTYFCASLIMVCLLILFSC